MWTLWTLGSHFPFQEPCVLGQAVVDSRPDGLMESVHPSMRDLTNFPVGYLPGVPKRYPGVYFLWYPGPTDRFNGPDHRMIIRTENEKEIVCVL
jgi:hypothetical protein